MFSKRNKRGFTMAETLLTVAIIGILSSAVFIGVMNYLRAMAQLERDGIAKEIFVSAQNHLTMAEGQGFLGRTEFGTVESGTGTEGAEVCYFVVNGADDFGESSVLGVMLPFASIEENIRVGNSYIIRYQKEPARVLDVFYTTKSGTRYGGNLSGGDYDSVMGLRDIDGASHKQDRRNYGSERTVLGWYGGEQARLLEKGKHLETPLIEVINAEKLTVLVTDPNDANLDASLRLVITGETSGKQKAIALNVQSMDKKNVVYDNISHLYTVTLDDVTTPGMHFSDLFEGDGFIPGEDISIRAVASSSRVLTNVANSMVRVTNSLYGEITENDGETGGVTASVGNFRHLENLDRSVSNVNGERAQIQVRGALQISDLSWDAFQEKLGGAVSIYECGSASGTGSGCYHPVTPKGELTYEGQEHRITGVVVNGSGDGGLFGSLPSGSTVKDLMLQDFNVTSTGNAGALCGTMENTEVINVAARGIDARVSGGQAAGGLIGSMEGGRVSGTGAALIVLSNGSAAGGLIGQASGANISSSYAAGHTTDGKYNREDGYNVTCSGGIAGGFIGSAGNSAITSGYSTCSVLGQTPGGFLGTGNGSVSSCYATGLVRTGADDAEDAARASGEEGAGTGGTGAPGGAGAASGGAAAGANAETVWETAAGAFAGTFSGSAADCGYLEIMNEKITEDRRVAYMKALGGQGTDEGITAFDADTETFIAFLGSPAEWGPAFAYDGTLIRQYHGKYGLKTIADLGGNPEENWFVNTHYGDWPIPEKAFVNR